MNIKKVIRELKREYPGGNIIVDDKDGNREIICELEPTKEDSEKSLALAVVGKSKKHYHRKSTEIYEVIKGKMNLYIGSMKISMKKGDKQTIAPGEVHWVEGDEAWFLTYSTPGWTPEDHILV